MGTVPNEKWGALCPRCKLIFHFTPDEMGLSGLKSVPQGTEYALVGPQRQYDRFTFPKGDFTAVAATCRKCNKRRTYPLRRLLHPVASPESQSKDERIKTLSGELSKTKAENIKLERRLDETATSLKSIEGKIGDLAAAYLELGKFVHEHTGQQPQQTKKQGVNYERTNPD